jgi:2-methylisocitrate lyase-like PEP mutase family enzyme
MTAIERFRELHQAGCFFLPNPWDAGSAVLLHKLGFQALASSSAGFAFTKGRPDHPSALSRDLVLEHLRELVTATPLPVNADFQAGYAADLEGVRQNVAACAATGVAGLSIEDATSDAKPVLYPRDEAIARLRAARDGIGSSGVLLTARCEAYLVGDPDAERAVFDRLAAYAEYADCLYAPGVKDLAVIARIARAVAPKPINVLATGHTATQLAEAGARRISVGSALSRVALGAFLRSARAMLDKGEFDFAGAATFADLNAFFSS